MSEKTETTRYIHWQDLAEQLGADTASEIDDYFGTARFEGPEPDESELPPRQTTLNKEEPEMNLKSDAAGPEEVPPAEQLSGERGSFAKSDAAPDELVIDWDQPEAVDESPAASPEPAAERETPRRRREKKKKEKAKVEASSADQPAAAPVETHWDDLVSTLGVTPDAPAASVAEPEPAAEDQPEPSRGSRSRRERTQCEESGKPEAPKKPAASSAFGAGLIELEEIEEDHEEVTQKAILNEMFVPSDEEPFQYEVDDETVISPVDDLDDEPDEFDGGVIVEGDEEFIEFEVQDLQPAGRRPRRRPPAQEEAEERPARSRRSQRDDTEKERPARARKRRDDTEPAGGSKRRDEEDGERPRRRRRRRGGRPETAETVDTDSVLDVDLDGGDEDSTDDGGRTRKPRKLPTWSETIDVIVDANLASRKKPTRRRRGGRSRRSN